MFKFAMNGHEWNIRVLSKKEIISKYQEATGEENVQTVYGLTDFEKKIIFLNENLCFDKTRQTLMHELMHCYIDEYISIEIELNEEALCGISSNAHDIIHKIAEDYFNQPVTVSISGILEKPSDIALYTKEQFNNELTRAIEKVNRGEKVE